MGIRKTSAAKAKKNIEPKPYSASDGKKRRLTTAVMFMMAMVAIDIFAAGWFCVVVLIVTLFSKVGKTGTGRRYRKRSLMNDLFLGTRC